MSALSLLSEGQTIPPFSFMEADGTIRQTTDLAGAPFVVYFYPKNDTPGCTKEACGFRDNYEAFQKHGITVIGVSPDNESSDRKFRGKHFLPFALAADECHAIAEGFGTWGEKTFMGRRFLGVHRTTFLINSAGQVAKVYPKVRPAEHALQILADIPSLSLIAP
jgi:peroxiredoxin Q/BCP